MTIPELMQTAFTVSLGAGYKSVEMLKDPMASMNKVMAEVNTLLTLPEHAPADLTGKAEAVAAAWMDKGMTLVDECRTAGEKFTGAK